MKPIYLKLAGLHSYREEQAIDFVTLCEGGLFGIFGPTGSGKSTILDAITLALYGQVVRMGGGNHPLQVLNQLEERLFVSFTFELGSGNERRRYTIEREFGRDKKGGKRPPEVRLIQRGRTPEEPDRVLESKPSAATAAIERLIGLTIHDFTRAVVLPQGQFSRFLTLKGSERNEMLQRIFHLEEYGEKLNERIRARYEQNKQALHQLQLEFAALGAAGPEALQAATSEWEEATQLEAKLNSQWQQLHEQKQTLQQLREWQKEQEALVGKLRELKARQAQIDQLSQQIARIEHSVVLWPRLERLKRLAAERTEQQHQQERHKAEAEAAQALLHTREQQLQEAEERLRREEPLVHKQKSRLALAAEWERELAALAVEQKRGTEERAQLASQLQEVGNRLQEAERQLAVWEEAWEQAAREEQELVAITEQRDWLAAVREAKQRWQTEQQKLADISREQAELHRQLQAAERAVQSQREAWQQQAALRAQTQAALAEAEAAAQKLPTEQALEQVREQLAQVKRIGKEWREWTRARQAWESRRADWERRMQEAAQQLAAAEDAWRTADAQRVARERERQEAEQARLEWQRLNMAAALRRSLRAGEPCPVCGSLHHPHRPQVPSMWSEAENLTQEAEGDLGQEAAVLDRVEKAIQALRKAEEAVRQAYERWQQLKAAHGQLREQEATWREEQAELYSRRETLLAELAQLGPEWLVEDVDALSTRYVQVEQQLLRWTQERSALRQRLEQLQQQLTLEREREWEQKSESDKQAALLERLRETAAQLNKRLKIQRMEAEQAQQQLDALRGSLPIEEVEGAHDRLRKADERLQQLRRQRLQLESDRQQVQAMLQEDRERFTRLAAQEAALAQRLAEIAQLAEQKRAQWQEVTGGEPALTCLERVEQQLAALHSAVSQAQQHHKEAAANLQHQQEALWKTEEALAQLERQHDEETAAISQEIARQGLGSPAEVERLYHERSRLAEYRRQVEEHRTLSAQLHYEEQRLRERLAGRTVTEEAWEQLTAAVEEMEQALANCRERAAVARQTLRNIEANHQRWLEVDERLRALEAEQSRLEDLKKLFEGKAFVQFIAEEKLVSIARDASFHLARMTKNRYALEIGAEGEFILRDEAAGGLRRPVSTLSGGETFLASLALALALSLEIQMRGGKLEFFFLDEGFGTLDRELLDVVLDALERLRMDDFTIGLISHVPEMRTRMPRRLVITPAEPMGRGSTITLEVE